MPGAANAMMRSAAVPSGGAAPRSISLDGVDQWADPGWSAPVLGTAGTYGIVWKMPVAATARYLIGSVPTAGFGGQQSVVMATGAMAGGGWRSDGNNGRAAVPNGTVVTGTWYRSAFSQPVGAYGSLYLNGTLAAAGGAFTGTSPVALVIGRRATVHIQAFMRCWYRSVLALSAPQIAAVDALILAGDDAGAAAYLLGIDPAAQYHAVTADSNLTSGTIGGIADLTGNSVGSTPWNTTTAGNLSTDVP